MVLEPDAGEVVADRQQEVVLAEVPGPEQRDRLTNDATVLVKLLVRSLQFLLCVSEDIEPHRTLRAGVQFDATIVRTGEQR